MKILNEIINNCVEIESSRNYWFVRTDTGRLYESFLDQGIIAIGYPEITLENIYVENKTRAEVKNDLFNKI